MNITAEDLLKKAHEMSPEDYMNFCDTIDEVIFSGEKDFLDRYFDEETDSIYVKKSHFGYNFEVVNRWGHVYGISEPGAYVEFYDIFAINRKTKTLYAQYHSMYGFKPAEKLPILPEELLNPIEEAVIDYLFETLSEEISDD